MGRESFLIDKKLESFFKIRFILQNLKEINFFF